MYTMGVDVGSASSKVVILEDGIRVVTEKVVQLGTGSSGPQRVLEEALEASGLRMEDMARVVATGYGRFSFEGADRQVSEISCHAKGIYHLVPSARTIIDIGGQDAKAIKLDERGGVVQFFMNDKCAAGTKIHRRYGQESLKLQPVKCRSMMQKLQNRLLSAVLVQYSPSLRLFLSFHRALQKKTLLREFMHLLLLRPAVLLTEAELLQM